MAPKLGDSESMYLLVCRELVCPSGLRWRRRNKADNLVLPRLAGSASWPWVGLGLVVESPFQDCSFVVGALYENKFVRNSVGERRSKDRRLT